MLLMAVTSKKGFLTVLVLTISLISVNGERLRTFAQETDDAKAFKILKEKIKDRRLDYQRPLIQTLLKEKIEKDTR